MALHILFVLAASAAAANAASVDSTRSGVLSRDAGSVALLRREGADAAAADAPAPATTGTDAATPATSPEADAPASAAKSKSSGSTDADADAPSPASKSKPDASAEAAAPKTNNEIKEVLVPAPSPKGNPCSDPCSSDGDQASAPGPKPPFQWSHVPAPSPMPTDATPVPPPPTKAPTGPLISNFFILGFPGSPGGALCAQFAADANVPKALLTAVKKINNVTDGPLDINVKCFGMPENPDKPGTVRMLANVSYTTDGEAPNRLWILSNAQLKLLIEQELNKIPPVEAVPGHPGSYSINVIGIGPPPPDIKKSNPQMVSKIKESAAAAGLKPNVTVDVGPCPEECKWPRCQTGGKHNGGESLGGAGADTCVYRCSAITFPCVANRWCGQGPDYEGGNSVDCTPCSGSSAAAAANASAVGNASQVGQGNTTASIATPPNKTGN